MKDKKRLKELLIQELKAMPIVQYACKKTGIGRSTFYRWKEQDKTFSKNVDLAVLEGTLLVNDLAESQLISAIRDQKLPAISFWLKNRHPAYTTRVEVTAQIKRQNKQLTPEQKKAIRKALKLASLYTPNHKKLNE